ncbi:hypothetical protein DR950_41745 [Kitasatospora xanthocidica]|uniref:Uncharacterized protein n=1 Tax=Kitasatospora xanthocidica TaxID=83382 RepID=A0A372ZHS7_9ACTN|nr:hypothetical protein [Kitasatospora xanthocidica]RGD55389.1 hypothetical protein DR950_41745 [Kitasatospora xanthocidica]
MENEEGFWQPVTPAYVELNEGQLEQLRAEVYSLAWNHAKKISARLAQQPKGAKPPTREALRLTQDYTLSVLRMLREVGPAADAVASEVASRAGSQGATYVQLGEAWGITRQSARGRWPGVTRVMVPVPEPTDLEMAGGTARVSYHPDESGWWYMATGANRRMDEAKETYDTREEALARAGAFLLANDSTEETK